MRHGFISPSHCLVRRGSHRNGIDAVLKSMAQHRAGASSDRDPGLGCSVDGCMNLFVCVTMAWRFRGRKSRGPFSWLYQPTSQPTKSKQESNKPTGQPRKQPAKQVLSQATGANRQPHRQQTDQPSHQQTQATDQASRQPANQLASHSTNRPTKNSGLEFCGKHQPDLWCPPLPLLLRTPEQCMVETKRL